MAEFYSVFLAGGLALSVGHVCEPVEVCGCCLTDGVGRGASSSDLAKLISANLICLILGERRYLVRVFVFGGNVF